MGLAPAPYSIPTTINSVVLATSLADYQPTMADNVYQHNAFLQMLSDKKELIDGGNSIKIKNRLSINLAKSVDILQFRINLN
jgi:hypothetical protein